MSDKYFYLDIDSITSDESDLIAAEAFQNGALGTEERLPFKQDGRHYEPQLIEQESTSLRIFFLEPPSPFLVEKIKSQWPEAIVRLAEEENKDWLAEWKKGYVPFELAQGFWVVPSWCDIPEVAREIISIDPGMAFGTGTHETTQLAAGFLLDYGMKASKKNSLFDVGTGTGILAIIAKKIGFLEVGGNDIDPVACQVARENAEINQINDIVFTEKSIGSIANEGSRFDWVVANIIDGVLCDLQNDLKMCLAPEGFLLLTGILAEREEIFLKEFNREKLKVIERRQKGEWVGYLMSSAGAGN